MKSFREELWFQIPSRRGVLNITPKIEEGLRKSGIREGLCLVNAMHITASVFINDVVVFHRSMRFPFRLEKLKRVACDGATPSYFTERNPAGRTMPAPSSLWSSGS